MHKLVRKPTDVFGKDARFITSRHAPVIGWNRMSYCMGAPRYSGVLLTAVAIDSTLM